MADATNQNTADNSVLIEWTSSVYGIFVGVWLGFFVEQLVENRGVFLIKALSEYYFTFIVGYSILFSVHTFYMVRWLWIMRGFSPDGSFSEALAKFKAGRKFAVSNLVALLLVGYLFSVKVLWVYMGVWAIFGWLLVVGAVVSADRRDWK
jgi:hypothetical protein